MSPTQLTHILLGSGGPKTTELHETFNFADFGAFRGSQLEVLKAEILKVVEARPAEFVIRISSASL